MDPSFYQRLSRMRWSVFESLNWWPMNGSQFHQPTCCLGMRKLLPVATWCESWGRLAPPLPRRLLYSSTSPLPLTGLLPSPPPSPWVSLARRRNSQRKLDAVALNLLCGICINSLHNAVQPPSGLCHLWATPIISILVNSSSESRNIISFFVFKIKQNE